MKIACLQFGPKLGQVQQNIDRATEMVSRLGPDDVDVLVLPEMAFTGYVFTSKDHIQPYLEDAETGPSIKWAKEQAIRLGAHVVVGFPEKRLNKDNQKEAYYNSSCLVSPEGKLLSVYSKTFLYYTDENWAEEGPGFVSTPIKGLGQVGFGICMDVNPYQFKADFCDYEFSNFHLNQRSDLILCSMAWNKAEESPRVNKVRKPRVKKSNNTQAINTEVVLVESEEDGHKQGDSKEYSSNVGDDSDQWEDEDSDDGDVAEETEGKEPYKEEEDEEFCRQIQFETLQYWAVRMNPFYSQRKKPHHEAIFVVANRIGREPGALFVGSSCVFKLGSDGPELLGTLPSNREGLLCVDV